MDSDKLQDKLSQMELFPSSCTQKYNQNHKSKSCLNLTTHSFGRITRYLSVCSSSLVLKIFSFIGLTQDYQDYLVRREWRKLSLVVLKQEKLSLKTFAFFCMIYVPSQANLVDRTLQYLPWRIYFDSQTRLSFKIQLSC